METKNNKSGIWLLLGVISCGWPLPDQSTFFFPTHEYSLSNGQCVTHNCPSDKVYDYDAKCSKISHCFFINKKKMLELICNFDWARNNVHKIV